MKQCNYPATKECFARPCNNCIPTDKSKEELDVEWKMENLKFYIIDIDHNRVFDGSYKQCAAELDRLMEGSGYWYIYDETDPNEAWQSGGDADLAKAEYFEWTCQGCGMRLPSTMPGCPNCGGGGEYEQQAAEAAETIELMSNYIKPAALKHTLYDMTAEEQAAWFDGIEEIKF